MTDGFENEPEMITNLGQITDDTFGAGDVSISLFLNTVTKLEIYKTYI